MTNQQDKEPDRVHSCSFSRRHALALGAGAMGGLAGCSELSDDSSGSNEPADETPTETPSLSESVEVSADFSIDEVVLELRVNLYSYAEDSLSGTLRLYSAPNLNRSNQTVLAEKSINQTEAVSEYTLEPEYDLGYAQHLQFTIETDNSEEAEEQPIYTPDETIVPFYNAARDTEMVLREPPTTPDRESSWTTSDPYFKTDFWFASPEESSFNTPNVPEDEYDQDWYDYRNITMTAVVRFPNYENITTFEDDSQSDTYAPAFDWAIVNIELDAWELIEAVRWNSIATGKIEDGELSASTATSPDYSGSNSNPGTNLTRDASTQRSPYAAYAISRYTGTIGRTNPLLFNGSRPITLRLANALEDAFDNPSFNTINTKEYHKAIALQVFVGQNPFSFETGSYVNTTEETINNWYKVSAGELDSAGNCQDATAMYGGIAIHLLDSTVGMVNMTGNVGAHMMGGLLNLEKPDEVYDIWPDHPSPAAGEVWGFSTDVGEVSPVEATWPDPTIGWKNPDGKDYELSTYLAETDVLTYIPINSDNQPDENGTPAKERERSEIPWEYYKEYTVIDDIENFRAS